MKIGEYQTFPALITLPIHRLVVVASDSGVMKAGLAGAAATAFDGVTTSLALINENASVVMFRRGNLIKMTASKAIAIGVAVYPAAVGKITDNVAGTLLGIAYEAAAADDAEILVLVR